MPGIPTSPEDFQAQDDVRTLQRAAELKANPARMAKAKAYAAEAAREMARVAGEIKVPENGEKALRSGFRRVG